MFSASASNWALVSRSRDGERYARDHLGLPPLYRYGRDARRSPFLYGIDNGTHRIHARLALARPHHLGRCLEAGHGAGSHRLFRKLRLRADGGSQVLQCRAIGIGIGPCGFELGYLRAQRRQRTFVRLQEILQPGEDISTLAGLDRQKRRQDLLRLVYQADLRGDGIRLLGR